ncbi:MAG: magnesium chelatase subunit I, partial [Arcticibacterium sp.]
DVKNPYTQITSWFAGGNEIDILNDLGEKDYENRLKTIDGLSELIEVLHPDIEGKAKNFLMEFALHGLAEFSLISKKSLDKGLVFKDLLDNLFDPNKYLPEDGEDDVY